MIYRLLYLGHKILMRVSTTKEKIDGIVAAIMALDRCIRQEGKSGSVYDDRGILIL